MARMAEVVGGPHDGTAVTVIGPSLRMPVPVNRAAGFMAEDDGCLPPFAETFRVVDYRLHMDMDGQYRYLHPSVEAEWVGR